MCNLSWWYYSRRTFLRTVGAEKDFNFGEITAADIGRMNVTKEERDKLRQKVPGLRNVALTAPYFHRGDVPTLDGR